MEAMRQTWTDDRMDDLNQQVTELRSELRADTKELRSDLKAQGDELRKDLKAQGDELRTEIKELGSELRSEIAESNTKTDKRFDQLEAQIARYVVMSTRRFDGLCLILIAALIGFIGTNIG
jgi:F0F1-type ATP synthase membrane subunit b/b'